MGVPLNTTGVLCLTGGQFVFLARRGGQIRSYPIASAPADPVRYRRGILFDRLSFGRGGPRADVYIFRDARARLERLLTLATGASAPRTPRPTPA